MKLLLSHWDYLPSERLDLDEVIQRFKPANDAEYLYLQERVFIHNIILSRPTIDSLPPAIQRRI